MLAGSSVHFDRMFLQHYHPQVIERFSHRLYDVSAVKLFCRSLGMPPFPEISAAHRAKDDIDESILHAKACTIWLEYRNDRDWSFDSWLHANRKPTS